MRSLFIFFSFILLTNCNSSEEPSIEENNVVTNSIEIKEKFLVKYDNTIWKAETADDYGGLGSYIIFSNTSNPIYEFYLDFECIWRREGRRESGTLAQNNFLALNEENVLIYKCSWLSEGSNGETPGSFCGAIKYEVRDDGKLIVKRLDENDDEIPEENQILWVRVNEDFEEIQSKCPNLS